jgi:hypothetical protein
MALVTLQDAKTYLHVDYTDEDELINSFLISAEHIASDVGRLSDADWSEIDAEPTDSDSRNLQGRRAELKIAILFAVGYLYEHREEANHGDMIDTMSNLLFSIREGVI